MEYYIGIDQSYTSTGIVIIDGIDQLIDYKIITSDKSKSIHQRAHDIAEKIMFKIEQYNDVYIAIEGLAYGMRGNATRDLAGLQFVIMDNLLDYNVKIVTPTELKKFATGNGRASKDEMIAKLPEYILNIFNKIKKSKGLADLADAYHLAMWRAVDNIPQLFKK